ncbi:hypothetical protein [Synechococcus sp. CBW1107]|uniref:hypothetical protein n=1 Tax=Synechococcus sp. CBW1107 TaxID=2789857 RepID=UPI002AD32460|nr:hypothetical protein [Synechococcus sp. CBW1107]CAK6686770.1 hypothetical protein ICNINCKA_00068 [Synechococcus sp. CBW1107]
MVGERGYRLVQQAIEQFERQHTVLVIAHRMSTIVNADQILVLERRRARTVTLLP